MDHERALFTIRFQFGAMFPHIGMEHQEHAGLLGAVESRDWFVRLAYSMRWRALP
jgi:hypothetical protein